MAQDNKDKPETTESGHDDHGSEQAHSDHAHGGDAHGDHGHDDHAPVLRDALRLGKSGDLLIQVSGGVGLVALLASVALGGGPTGKEFQHAYLTAYIWGLSIALGALFWVTLQHLFNAKWSIVVRRLGEIFASSWLALAVLALPIFYPLIVHDDVLYRWVNHEYMHSNHALHSKIGYLNSTAFFIRMGVYFLFWGLFGRFLFESSKKQEAGNGAKIAQKLQSASAPGMIGVALTLTFAAFDLLMSLDPIFFSTIFGVYYLATCVLTFMSTLALASMWLQSKGILASAITREHYHDIGKMMFGFTAFWTYIGFSQFMLIWYANIPEETHWFHDRLVGNWFNPTLFLAAAHFVIPFFGLMSREVKRNKTTLAFWAFWVLAICWFDMHWLVAPNFHKAGISLGLVDFTTLIGVAGILIAVFASRAKKVNLIPTGDPRLGKSLAFENI